MLAMRLPLAFALITFIGLGVASAQTSAWPTKPIKLLVGSPAGSGTDAVSRLVASKVSDVLGQVFVVENKRALVGKLLPK